MHSRPREHLLCLLSGLHETLPDLFSGAELRSSVLVFKVGLVVPGRWHLVDLFLHQVLHPLPTGKALLLGAVLLNKGSASVTSWTRSRLSVHKSRGISVLGADLRPRMCRV